MDKGEWGARWPTGPPLVGTLPALCDRDPVIGAQHKRCVLETVSLPAPFPFLLKSSILPNRSEGTARTVCSP